MGSLGSSLVGSGSGVLQEFGSGQYQTGSSTPWAPTTLISPVPTAIRGTASLTSANEEERL